MNSTIRRLKEILVAFIKATLLGESCTKRDGQTTHSLKSLRWENFRWTGLGSEDLKEEKNLTSTQYYSS